MTPRSTAIVIATLVSALGLAGASPAPEESDISVFAVNCTLDGDAVPSVSVSQFGYPSHVTTVQSTTRSLAFGMHELDFKLAPGDYSIGVIGKGRGCGSDDQFTVLPGLPRHIDFPRIGALILGPSCSVAGRLPLPGLSVRLITGSGKDLPVFVDGGGYYSQDFGRGKYTLEIGMMQYTKVDIPLDYSDQKPGEFCDKKIVRDITLNDLRTTTT